MKKRTSKLLSLLLSLSMLFSLMTPAMAEETTAPAESGKIVILHTNDVHCEINQTVKDDKVTAMGYAAVAAYKAEMEQTYGEGNVTLVDAGDAIQGGPIGILTKGSYLVDIMNAVGYDLAIPGNHEFDYGMETFLTLAKEKAEYTYLSSNFMDLKTNKSVFDAYELITYGDVQVAYVGISTPETLTKSTPTYFQDKDGKYVYGFCEDTTGAALYTNVQKSVDSAVAAGADYVVAVAHLGSEGSTTRWNAETVIKNTTGIDAIIDGHSHELYAKTLSNKGGEEVLLAQTGTKLEGIGQLVIDTATGEITSEIIGNYAEQDPTVAATLETMNAEFDALLATPVAKTTVPLTMNDPVTDKRAIRNAETNLGDLVADAYRTAMGADVALINGGGIRASIASGDVTNGGLLAVQPYSNELCLIEVTGQQIKDALEMGARKFPEELGGFMQVSGLTYTIDASVPSGVVTDEKEAFVKVEGDYRVKNIMVGDAALDVAATYTMASHNYMIESAGDGMTMFQNCKMLQYRTKADNQAVIDYVVGTLKGEVGAEYANPYGQGRIAVINNTAKAPVWYYAAARYAIESGMVKGTDSKGSFSPDGTVTRGTVCQILFNIEKPVTAKAAAFTDVSGMWYENAANWAVSAGIVADGTTFGGDTVITRAEVAQLLANYCKMKNITADTSGMAMKEAPDYDTIPAEFLPGMTFCYYAGIMVGDQNGNLTPSATLNRAQLAQVLLNLSNKKPVSTVENVTIKVPAKDGIPAHDMPATVTLPVGEGKFPSVVILTGTGSDRTGLGVYPTLATKLAEQGIASIAVDFMGLGTSTADYIHYNFTSANLDAKAAADYMASLSRIDGKQTGILGWSQGGTNALLAAAAYPETFKAVITWAGALNLNGDTLFAGTTFAAAHDTAKKDGSYEMPFDWRSSLKTGLRWFDEVVATDVLKKTATIKAPILALYGDLDVVVPTTDADKIVDASTSALSATYVVKNADHTLNAYSGDLSAVVESCNASADFFVTHLIPAAADKAA